MPSTATRIAYVTSSAPKQEENRVFREKYRLADGTLVRDVVDFEIRPIPVKETLEVDIRRIVQAEVVSAYSMIKVPCIVEHAGLVFEGFKDYPGGLTKPMWNELGDRFVEETRADKRRVTARAVVAYCDGQSVETFVGETSGTAVATKRGSREFYWDSIFVPDDPTAGGRTYAEIVEAPDLGLEYKVLRLSQSSKAMAAFVEHIRRVGVPALWA